MPPLSAQPLSPLDGRYRSITEPLAQHLSEAGLNRARLRGQSGTKRRLRELDEVIVCTLPGRSSKWLQHDFPHRVARFTGLSVTHVVADDLRPAPVTSPAPAHEREPMGPLSVLSWGGRQSGSR